MKDCQGFTTRCVGSAARRMATKRAAPRELGRAGLRLCGMLLLVLVLSGALAQTRWNMHVAWPESNFHTQGVLAFAELVNENSDGQLEIIVNSGGSLGFQGGEILRIVRNGTLPIAEVLMGNVQGDEAIFGLTSLPLLVEDYESARELYDTARPYYEEALARNNQILLYAAPWPPSGFFTNDMLETPEDLADLKVRTYDSNSAEFVEGLGGQGLAIPFSELFTALSTGLVNAVLTSTPTGVDSSLWEVTDTFTRIGYAFPLNMVTVNREMFERLPSDVQEVVLEAAAETETRQWEASANADALSQAALETNGVMVVSSVSEELLDVMRDVASELEAQWLEQVGESGQALLGSFRE